MTAGVRRRTRQTRRSSPRTSLMTVAAATGGFDLIDRPTLVIHTTFFAPHQKSDVDSERASACGLGAELYDLLTRPRRDPLAWGPGIPVRIGTWPERIDRTEADHAIIVPVLGGRAFSDKEAREAALTFMERWHQAGAR